MEIGQPTETLPQSARSRTKYAPVWIAVETARGMWVPVICGSAKARKRLQGAATSISDHGRHPRMCTNTDSDAVTLYIRLAKGE